MDFYGFYTGKIFDAYKYLGAHINRGKSGKAEEVVFRTFAPSASRISVIGEFNGWTETPMEKVHDGNFWELISKEAKPGMMYKYRIYDRAGNCIDHCDPYGYGMELRPNTASIIRDMDAYKFHDGKWMKKRSDHSDLPLNVYELHFGSFRKPSEEPDAWYDYEEMADILLPYLKENEYNYLEIMPLNEYPCDESWGYQGTGFFSPTSRYGTADQLKYFVDRCHENDIGVILDFVPVHFAVDDYALANYDGTALYEYPHSDVGDSEWGSRNFMHSRGEVRSFLQSAAEYWLNEYHIDGLRMDAISRAIYWQGMPERGVNSNAVEFLRYMNQGLKERHPSVILAAEDSTSFPGVTKPVEEGGLGFDYKWNMGWMHDFTEYMKLDPYFRKNAHNMMTFASSYAYSENYILVLSHDEVVHLKCSMINKMPGLGFDKYANLKAGYAFMMGHPGKKLLFMGQEFAQLREWSEERELDWYLLAEPEHQAIQNWYKDLLHLYKKNKAMYEMDSDPAGFEWINADDCFRSIYSFLRHSKDNKKNLLFVCNFTPMERRDYRVGVPRRKQCRLILNSDDVQYGGTGEPRPLLYKPVKQECDGQKYSFAYPLPPYGVAVFEF